MFVIDTNVASELMRPEPNPTVAAWIARQDAEAMYLTAVNEAELLYGVAIMPAGRRRNALEAAWNLSDGSSASAAVPTRPWSRYPRCRRRSGPG